MTLTLTKNDIPSWLHESKLYRSLDDDDEEEFLISRSFFKKNSKIKSLEDFKTVLYTYDHWILDEIPKSIYRYGLKHYHEIIPIVLEYENNKDHSLSDFFSEKYIYRKKEDKILFPNDFSYLSDEVSFKNGGVIENKYNIEKFHYNNLLLNKINGELISFLNSNVFSNFLWSIEFKYYVNHNFSKFKNIIFENFKSVNKTLKELNKKFDKFLLSNNIDLISSPSLVKKVTFKINNSDSKRSSLNKEELEILHGKNFDKESFEEEYETIYKKLDDEFSEIKNYRITTEINSKTVFDKIFYMPKINYYSFFEGK